MLLMLLMLLLLMLLLLLLLVLLLLVLQQLLLLLLQGGLLLRWGLLGRGLGLRRGVTMRDRDDIRWRVVSVVTIYDAAAVGAKGLGWRRGI